MNFLEDLNIKVMDINEINRISPLVLAYIGDAVYEVYIRTYIINRFKGKVNYLHRISTNFVKASAQAEIVRSILDELEDEEIRIVKRGRNQKSTTVPKNANLSDYKHATGFEALLGFLYLTNKKERLMEIIEMSIKIIEDKTKDKGGAK